MMKILRLFFPLVLGLIADSSNRHERIGLLENLTPSPAAQESSAGQHLLLPDLYTLPPSDLVIEIQRTPVQKLLLFSNSIANRGPGALEVWGAHDRATGKTVVTQRYYKEDGTMVDRTAGEFSFHPRHDHWHMVNFARYELWSLTSGGDLSIRVGLTDKVSYCLRDNFPDPTAFSAPKATYVNCDAEKQGISTGWVDRYRSTVPGQVIDISSLPYHGVYALRSTVDPENQLLEVNETNNSVLVYVEIYGSFIRIIDKSEIPFDPYSLDPPRL